MKLFAVLLSLLLASAGLPFPPASHAGSVFTPQVSQLPAVVPVGVVLEYSLSTLPAGDQFQWADGGCVVAADFPAFAVGAAFGNCPAGQVAKPDRRGRFARGWIPAGFGGIQSSGAVSGNAILATGHAFRTGQRVRMTSGAVTGLSANTDYFAIVDRAISADYIAFATTRQNAMNGTKITLSGTSTAVIGQWEDPDNNTRLNYDYPSTQTGIGGLQGDAIATHDHLTTITNGNMPYGTGTTVAGTTGANVLTNGAARTSGVYTQASNMSLYENRPANIAMGYIVRVK
jgi:hypothetical protein